MTSRTRVSARPGAKRSGSQRSGSGQSSAMEWVWIGQTTTPLFAGIG